jgi:hypothetical protein
MDAQVAEKASRRTSRSIGVGRTPSKATPEEYLRKRPTRRTLEQVKGGKELSNLQRITKAHAAIHKKLNIPHRDVEAADFIPGGAIVSRAIKAVVEGTRSNRRRKK